MYLNKIKTTISFFLILSVISINKFAFAEIIKPNNGIEPLQVVKIQLRGLKNNSKEYKDDGIEQTWAFAHPDNQRYTGPLEKFKIMLKGKAYSMLLNHKEHNIKEIFLSDDVATFEVIILNAEKEYFKFKWQVEKYKSSNFNGNFMHSTYCSNPNWLVSLG